MVYGQERVYGSVPILEQLFWKLVCTASLGVACDVSLLSISSTRI